MNDRDQSDINRTPNGDLSAQTRDWESLVSHLNEQFPTDAACMEEIVSTMYGDEPLPCRSCPTGIYERAPGSRNGVCSSCGDVHSFTAGTLFHGMRSPRPWLLAVKLMESGAVLSSPRLAKLIAVSQSTAWEILNKLKLAIEMQLPEDAPSVTSSLFYDVIHKRSWSSPACEHPTSEQQKLEAASESNQRDEVAKTNQSLAALEHAERTVFQLLVDRDTVHFDEICQHSGLGIGEVSAALTTLEFANLIQRDGGERFSIHQPSPPTSVDQASDQEKMIAVDIMTFVTDHFDGISRRYLQPYIAVFWFYWDKQTWRPGALLRACRYWQAIKQPPQPLVKVMPTSCVIT